MSEKKEQPQFSEPVYENAREITYDDLPIHVPVTGGTIIFNVVLDTNREEFGLAMTFVDEKGNKTWELCFDISDCCSLHNTLGPCIDFVQAFSAGPGSKGVMS